MSELKAFTFGLGQYFEDGSPCVVAVDDEDNPRLASDEKFYLKSEADAVIAEKDKVISEKDEEIRRLHRAVYKACANWACAKMEYAQFDSNMFMCGFVTDKEVSWGSMMKKCLKKVEEYK